VSWFWSADDHLIGAHADISTRPLGKTLSALLMAGARAWE